MTAPTFRVEPGEDDKPFVTPSRESIEKMSAIVSAEVWPPDEGMVEVDVHVYASGRLSSPTFTLEGDPAALATAAAAVAACGPALWEQLRARGLEAIEAERAAFYATVEGHGVDAIGDRYPETS